MVGRVRQPQMEDTPVAVPKDILVRHVSRVRLIVMHPKILVSMGESVRRLLPVANVCVLPVLQGPVVISLMFSVRSFVSIKTRVPDDC